MRRSGNNFYDNYDDGKQRSLGEDIQQQHGPSSTTARMDPVKGVVQTTQSTGYVPQNPAFNAENAGLVAKETLRKNVEQKETWALPSPPPPGYDDNTVLGAAASQMMSTINQTKGVGNTQSQVPPVSGGMGKNDLNNRAAGPKVGLDGTDNNIRTDLVFDKATVKSSIDHEKTVQPGGHSFLDTPELVMDNQSSNHLVTDGGVLSGNGSDVENTTTEYHPAPVFQCREPWSRVKPGVFPAFWRVVYWTSQVLTW